MFRKEIDNLLIYAVWCWMGYINMVEYICFHRRPLVPIFTPKYGGFLCSLRTSLGKIHLNMKSPVAAWPCGNYLKKHGAGWILAALFVEFLLLYLLNSCCSIWDMHLTVLYFSQEAPREKKIFYPHIFSQRPNGLWDLVELRDGNMLYMIITINNRNPQQKDTTWNKAPNKLMGFTPNYWCCPVLFLSKIGM